MNTSITYILKIAHCALTQKDISLNICIDFTRAETLPWEGSGEQQKQRSSVQQQNQRKEEEAGMYTGLKSSVKHNKICDRIKHEMFVGR